MFQTEIILWLQSMESPALSVVLSIVSLLGYPHVYAALILLLGFGMRLRPSVAVLAAFLLAGILTEALKTGVALPRPRDVDARVRDSVDPLRPPAVEHGGASSFWALPASAGVLAVRSQPGVSYGFPSGHVSSAAAFFLGMAWFFRSRPVLMFALSWIPLTMLSRLYLGRHFLADVLGGLAVGGLSIVASGTMLAPNTRIPSRPVASLTPVALVCATLVLLTPFTRLLDPEDVGRLAGLVVGYGAVLATGLPADSGTIGQRSGRVMTSFLFFLAGGYLTDRLLEATGWEHSRLASLAGALLVTAVILAGTVAVSRRLGWYLTQEPA
jgi:membrane-associated phospholipid phosphatase